MPRHSQSYGGKCRPILPISTDVLIVGAGPSGLTLAAFTLMIPQDKVERTLIRHLQGLGKKL